MIYVVYSNGVGLRVEKFLTITDAKSWLNHVVPLQYVIITGSYNESNL